MSFGMGGGGGGMGHGPRHHIRGYRDVTGKVFDWDITKRLLAFLRPHVRQMVQGVLLMVVSAGLALLTPYLIGRVAIDRYIAAGDLNGLTWTGLAILAAYGLDFAVTGAGWSSAHRRGACAPCASGCSPTISCSP